MAKIDVPLSTFARGLLFAIRVGSSSLFTRSFLPIVVGNLLSSVTDSFLSLVIVGPLSMLFLSATASGLLSSITGGPSSAISLSDIAYGPLLAMFPPSVTSSFWSIVFPLIGSGSTFLFIGSLLLSQPATPLITRKRLLIGHLL